MKKGISDYIQSVDGVFLLIVAISAVILIGVTAVMIYFVIKYNRKRHPKAVNIEGNVALEITWIAIPVVLVLTMFYFGFSTFKELRIIPRNAYTIKVTGQMWKWTFAYPNGKKSDTLFVPVNRPLKLILSSLDVNHSFYIPSFRIKEDLVYGKETYLAFIPDKTGSYEITCAEYCGLNHSYMYNKIHVIPQDKFEEWVALK